MFASVLRSERSVLGAYKKNTGWYKSARCIPKFSYHKFFDLIAPGRFGNGTFGSAEYIFNTSLPPTGPECRVIKGAGSGHEAQNTLVCNGWTSSSGSTALMYDYFYKTAPNGTEYLIQTTRHARVDNIRLPPGLEEYNYTLYMKAVISDKMGSRSEVTFEHQVRLNGIANG